MGKKSVATSSAPQVLIDHVQGDLLVKGWDVAEVVAVTDEDSLTLEQQDDSIVVSCLDDLELKLPEASSVRLTIANGDAHFKLLKGVLNTRQVHGSLTLRSVASVHAEAIHGDLSVKGVVGGLHVAQIHGNVAVREGEGGIFMPMVMGNLDIRDVEGDIQVFCEGNARLKLSNLSGENYQVKAGGNIYCHIPEDADLKLDLSSQGGIIRIKLLDQAKVVEAVHHELVMGSGTTQMTLSAGGDIYLFGQSADRDEVWEGDFAADFERQFRQQFEAQVQAQMRAVTQQLEEQVARISERIGRTGMSPEEIQRIVKDAQLASERGAARAEEKIRRAQEKLERKLEVARQRHEAVARRHPRRTWGFEFSFPHPPSPPREPQVSEEERLMILQMLEQKKISLEEAEMLLSALEGKEM